MEDDWDFYRCQVDDAPASISLNLALIDQLESFSEDTLYAVHVEMVHASQHGMGDSVEADTMHVAEDALVNDLEALGLKLVGCLRNRGVWQITLMGPEGVESELRRLAERHLRPLPREFSIVSKHDPAWEYYSEFLFPNAERMRWIQNRRVVDALESRGDPLTERRRVDHWIYFPDGDSQTAFASAAATHGFEAEPLQDTGDFGVQVFRVDSVQLDDIHEVTVLLAELASSFAGSYDGWETSVETDC